MVSYDAVSCPNGWDAIFNYNVDTLKDYCMEKSQELGLNVAMNCCSIHGYCGVGGAASYMGSEDYYCSFGVSPNIQIWLGFILYVIVGLVLGIQVEKACIRLMEKHYKKSGIPIDAKVVKVIKKPTFKSNIYGLFCLCDDVRALMKVELLVEYDTTVTEHSKIKPIQGFTGRRNLIKQSTGSQALGLTEPLLDNLDTNGRSITVQKKLLVSEQVYKDTGNDKNKNDSSDGVGNNVDGDDNRNNTVRLLVLPDYPYSGYPQGQVDMIIVRRRKYLWFMYSSFIFFTISYFCLTVWTVSLTSMNQRPQAIQHMYFSFAWAPVSAYLATFYYLLPKRFNEWLYTAKEVSSDSQKLSRAIIR